LINIAYNDVCSKSHKKEIKGEMSISGRTFFNEDYSIKEWPLLDQLKHIINSESHNYSFLVDMFAAFYHQRCAHCLAFGHEHIHCQVKKVL